MHFNESELASLASNITTRFDKEGLLIITERQESIFRRSDVKLECWCKLRGNLLFYLKDKNPKSSVAGALVLQDCQPRIHNEEPGLEGYVFDLDFKDSPSHRIGTHSAADRLDWVRSIQACSNETIDLKIKKLEELIAAARISATTTTMGNRITQGLPLPLPLPMASTMIMDAWPALSSAQAVEAPFEGDLIQF